MTRIQEYGTFYGLVVTRVTACPRHKKAYKSIIINNICNVKSTIVLAKALW